MYYLRTKPAVNALQFTVNKSLLRPFAIEEVREKSNTVMESKEDDDTCRMCSS